MAQPSKKLNQNDVGRWNVKSKYARSAQNPSKSLGRTQHSSKPYSRPSPSIDNPNSRTSSLDSLIDDSDFSDSSFYDLPWFAKNPKKTSHSTASTVGVVVPPYHSESLHAYAFPEHRFQENKPLIRSDGRRALSRLSKYSHIDPLTSVQKPLQQYYRPYYNQYNPYSTMNSEEHQNPLQNGARENGTGLEGKTQYMNGKHSDYNVGDGQQKARVVHDPYAPVVAVSPDFVLGSTRSSQHVSPSCSPESDDTLCRSSSGIASDIESPRSLKSCLVETPRGLVHSPRGDDLRGRYSFQDLSFQKEPAEAKSVSFSKNSMSEKHLNGGHQLSLASRENEFRHRLHNTTLSSKKGPKSASSAVKPHHVQSNIIDSDGSYSYNRASTTGPTSQIPVSSIYHHQSPPTRDTSKSSTFQSSHLRQTTGRIPAMSLYEETGMAFGKHLVQTPSRNLQSSYNGSISFEKDKQTNMNKTPRPRYNNELVLNNRRDAGVKNSLQDPLSRSNNLSMNNGKHDPSLNHVSLVNSFSVDTSRRITSTVWAMKLLEAEQTTTPAIYQQLLLKARLFRRWHQRARLRRLDRESSENKMNKAVEFWRAVTLNKYLTAWKEVRKRQETKADDVYRRHMLETGLRGLKFASQVNSQARNDVMTKISGRLMAKYWLKWQNHMYRRRSENMRSAFNRWRVFKLEGNRDKILDGMANKHLLSRSYVKWKMRYQVEQNNSVATLNFKITLLTKCWHSWRIYTAQRIVKTRTNEVARIHYENNLQARTFRQWLEGTKKSSVASNLSKRRIVVKAFYSWRNWTEYAKVIHQRFQSMCKEYYNRALVKQTFIQWKRKLMVKQAENFHGKLLQKRVYRLWFLRYRRKVIHRHLCRAMARKGKKRRFFRKLLEVTRDQRERRNAFVGVLQRMLLSKMLKTWKEHTLMEKSLRIRYTRITQMKQSRLTVKAMNQWLFAMKVANFKKQAKVNWSKRCVRKACEEWKLLMKRKQLEQTLIESRPAHDIWILRVAWNTWIKKKKMADKEHEWAKTVRTILTRNFKRRIFQAWRVTNQQQQIIAPMVQRRERKHTARAFDAWRLYLYRQKYIVSQQSRADEKLVDRHFLYWRDRMVLRIKERNAIASLQNSKLTRAFKAWQAHVREIRHKKLKERAERLQLLSVYFKKWTICAEERAEQKEQKQAEQSRKVLLVRWGFRYWKDSSERQRLRLNLIEEQVTSNRDRLALNRFFNIWKRWFIVANIARDHIEYRKEKLMRTVFTAWGDFIKQEINEQVNLFSTGLSLDCSMGSNMGSLLRSTLESSASDFLSSTSGYGTSFRRGSGSVYTLRSPRVSQRDDDVASLPGRIDQMHPDSPRRIASPITVLRESSHVAHVTSPLVVQTPTSSPSPSPPDLHLSLPTSVASYESVFTPVRDKEFLLSKPDPLERYRSVSLGEDDEFEHMSMTSGMSSASVRDKEMVVIDTILHWRSLPLSLTFRSWLKYTREQKLLRDLLFYAKEKKTREILASAVKRWRRELYIKVAARQYLYDGTRLRCLRAWHMYVETRRMKERRVEEAKNLNRSILIKRFFGHWRNKFIAKRRLQTIVEQWQKKAIITDKHKAIGEKVQLKHNQQALREKFYYWVLMTRKSQEARRFYLERLLPKFFVSWHLYSSTRADNRKKGACFNDRRVLAMAFKEWQERFISERKAKEFVEVKEIECSLDILKVWHEWANGVRTRRVQWRNFHRSLEIKTMKGIFHAWRDQVLQQEHAQECYQHSIMRKVLLAWKNTAQTAVENKLKASALKERCSASLVKRSFNFWRRLYLHRQLAISHAQQKDRDLLRELFLEWRDYALETRAEKYYLKAMLKKTYYQWYDECLSRKKARRLLRSWKNITEDSKALNSKAMELCQLSEKKVLHQTFTFWVQEAHKIQKAKLHYATNTTRSSLTAWFRYAHTKVRCRRALAEIEASKNQELLSKSFLTWRDSFTRNVNNQEILEEHLRNKEIQSLESCMLKWRKYALNCRATKHHDGRLQYMSFMTWKLRLSQKKGLEKIMERVFYRRIRQAAIHWRQWTVQTKRQQAGADELQVELGNRLVRVCFAYWVNSTEQSTRAKNHHNKTVMKRSLVVWKSVIRAKIKERKVMEKFQKEVMAKKVARMFKEWRATLEQSQKNNKLISSQMCKHNKLVLEGCMKQWMKHLLKCRADKHFNIVLTARFFLEWKARFDQRMEQKQKEKELGDIALQYYQHHLRKLCFRSWYYDVLAEKHLEMKQQQLVQKHFYLWKKKQKLKNIASELGDRQVFAKYWGKWRNQLVRKRVSELMMKHEEKKLLSEVFGAWYKLTMIRRRLLNEWNIALTEKWFRKWMQKYNES